MFDPTKFNFVTKGKDDEWETVGPQEIDEGLIGKYKLKHDRGWFDLYEIYYHNNDSKSKMLYSGKIPTNEFAFELFKNMYLELPVIKRDIKIGKLIH